MRAAPADSLSRARAHVRALSHTRTWAGVTDRERDFKTVSLRAKAEQWLLKPEEVSVGKRMGQGAGGVRFRVCVSVCAFALCRARALANAGNDEAAGMRSGWHVA